MLSTDIFNADDVVATTDRRAPVGLADDDDADDDVDEYALLLLLLLLLLL
jgi:hypothetical protein